MLGQNVNSYGKNLETPTTFAALLHLLNDIEGLERIRFMTSHPKDFSEELIDAVASIDKVCKHIHLPLQSGSSRILKLMNRKYTKEHYLDLIDRIIALVSGSFSLYGYYRRVSDGEGKDFQRPWMSCESSI